MSKYIVLGAMYWRMEDEKTGAERDGLNLWILDQEPAATDDTRLMGFKPIKVAAPGRLKSILATFPGVYDLDTRIVTKTDNRGKEIPAIEVRDAKFLAAVKFDTVTATKSA